MEIIKFDETKEKLKSFVNSEASGSLYSYIDDSYVQYEYDKLNRIFNNKLNNTTAITNLVVAHTLYYNMYTYTINNNTNNIAIEADGRPLFFASYSDDVDLENNVRNTYETYASYKNGNIKDKIKMHSINYSSIKAETIETYKSDNTIDIHYQLIKNNDQVKAINIGDITFEETDSDTIDNDELKRQLEAVRKKIYDTEERLNIVVGRLLGVETANDPEVKMDYKLKRKSKEYTKKAIEDYRRKQLFEVIK